MVGPVLKEPVGADPGAEEHGLRGTGHGADDVGLGDRLARRGDCTDGQSNLGFHPPRERGGTLCRAPPDLDPLQRAHLPDGALGPRQSHLYDCC